MKFTFTLLCLLITPGLTLGLATSEDESTDVVTGLIYDRISALPVHGAQISIDGNRGVQDVSTDEFGVFALKLAKPTTLNSLVSIYIQKDGYNPRKAQIPAGSGGRSLAEIWLNPIKRATLKNSAGSDKSPYLFINYLRLFGAFQVPLVLAQQYDPESRTSNKSTTWERYQDPPDENIRFSMIAPQVEAFWHNWEYKDALPVRSLPWRNLFNSETRSQYVPHSLLVFANKGNNDERMLQSYLVKGENCGNEGAGRVSLACPGKYSTEEVMSALEETSAKVGFLSLIIENTSGTDLHDVYLHFREFEKQTRVLEKTEESDMVDKLIEQKPEQYMVIGRIKTHASLLWLLSVYLKDDNGYPKEYLSGVDLPTRITFRMGSSPIRQNFNVRKPLMEKAAKIAVPFGWYYQ